MAKSSAARSGAQRLKALPWAALLRAGMVVGNRWRSLSEKERARLRSIVRSSAGRPSNLSEKDRKELRRLARKLDLKGMGGELVGLARKGRRGRGRKR